MKGDFSRFTFDARKHFASVLTQLGRVWLDEDSNESAQILQHRWEAQTIDTIGKCGAPIRHAGFQVRRRLQDSTFSLTAGRIYVDGLMCELEDQIAYEAQEHFYFPYPDPLNLDLDGSRTDIVFIKAWLRHVSALEDPDLLEPALGGADTTTRLQTAWQVRVVQNVPNATCASPIPGSDPSDVKLTAAAVPVPAADNPCAIDPQGGFSGLENRLYRVEIHDVTSRNDGSTGLPATFKWSRDNNSIGAGVEFILQQPNQIRVTTLGRDGITRFRKGQFVEILGDRSELRDGHGEIAQIDDIDELDRILRLDRDLHPEHHVGHPRVRRWDMSSEPIPVGPGPFVLEDGIQISFDGGPTMRSGDFWTFAARTDTGSIQTLQNALPQGIDYHFCTLAVVTWTKDPDGLTFKVTPCAPLFPPLTELPQGGGGGVVAHTGRVTFESGLQAGETVFSTLVPHGFTAPPRPVTVAVTSGIRSDIHPINVALTVFYPEGGDGKQFFIAATNLSSTGDFPRFTVQWWALEV